jgi:hypothetical protein
MYIENGNSGIMKKSGMDVNLIGKVLTQPFMQVLSSSHSHPVLFLLYCAGQSLDYHCGKAVGIGYKKRWILQ